MVWFLFLAQQQKAFLGTVGIALPGECGSAGDGWRKALRDVTRWMTELVSR